MASTETQKYNKVAATLHWIMALLIIGMLGLGIYMRDFVPDSQLALKFSLYQWHKSFGVLILLLAIVRLIWRLTHKTPPLPDNLAPWERFAAHVTHYGFYVLIIGMPLSGWAMVTVSPFNVPTLLFGVISWPHIPFLAGVEDKKAAEDLFKVIHYYLGWGIIALLVLHLGAVVKHTFILKDGTLGRMWPFGQR